MALPSVLLHDHLDGGLRPETVLDLAAEYGYQDLPSSTESGLKAWFDQAESGSLETYLEAFEHTIGVMQASEALERVAHEAALDLAADGVVYVESRFCPQLHTRGGLAPRQVIEAVSAGFARGEAETGIRWVLIIDALRQFDWSMDMARLAESSRDLGVVAFDLAGPEAAHPPSVHLAACRHARESGLRLTIHAGEAGGTNGVAYMASAMDVCGAERLGHGVEVVQDCVLEDGEVVKLGAVASRIRDRQIPLEMCPASNLAISRLAASEHPIGALYRAGFNVTLNTDNRLMSNTSMSKEFEFVEVHHGFAVSDLASITKRAVAAAFCDYTTKVALWEETIAPAYLSAGASLNPVWR